jgi:hypothetical protein
MTSTEYRRRVAALARRVRAGEMDFIAFLDDIGPQDHPYETGDRQVDELIDLLEHEPKVGGVFGVSFLFHRAHVAKIDQLIAALESQRG